MFKALNRFALERPVIFWSCAIGAVGPVMVWTVPSIRRNYFGFKGYEPLPITYPRNVYKNKQIFFVKLKI
ncbi:hypothetical protein G6F62_012342 [Rhizopus arrhizus]|nr:hypothetical protein G6F62_012342 [Rhizopus arrhizus]